jgi:hypothetical protein
MATLSIRGNEAFWRSVIEKAKDALAGEYGVLGVNTNTEGAEGSEDVVEINFLPAEDGPKDAPDRWISYAILWLPTPDTVANGVEPWQDWSDA